MSSPGSNASRDLPAVDERLVAEDCGYEIDDGKLVRVPPALEPHAERHAKLAALLEAHAADDFNVAIDMLTRTSETTDIAPDASVYPRARDQRTGGRQLEHLAFEIVSTETLAHAGGKAKRLVERGVRRVFAIDVERVRAFEWSAGLETWSILDTNTSIEDAALAAPLPIQALLVATRSDDAVAAALVAKHNPVIEAVIIEATARARAEAADARAGAVISVLVSRGLRPSIDERERILGERDPARLERWLARVATCASVAALLGVA